VGVAATAAHGPDGPQGRRPQARGAQQQQASRGHATQAERPAGPAQVRGHQGGPAKGQHPGPVGLCQVAAARLPGQQLRAGLISRHRTATARAGRASRASKHVPGREAHATLCQTGPARHCPACAGAAGLPRRQHHAAAAAGRSRVVNWQRLPGSGRQFPEHQAHEPETPERWHCAGAYPGRIAAVV